MNKLFFLTIATLGLTAVMSAGTVSCAVNQNTTPLTATTAGTTVVCPGVSAAIVGAGNQITAITVFARGTFNDSAITPPYSGQLRFDFNELSGEIIIPTITGSAPTGGPDSIGDTGVLSASQGGLSLASLAGFNVDVLETLLSGGRLPSSSNVTVSYEYTVSAVPEPATYAMIGLGLGALAFIRRK